MRDVGPAQMTLCHGVIATERFRDRVEAAAAAGRVGLALDLPSYERHLAAGETETDMIRTAQLNGVRVDEIWSLYGSLGPDESGSTERFANRLCNLAERFGAQMLGAPTGLEGDPGAASDRLGELCDRAARSGLRIGVEFVAIGPGPDVGTISQVVEATGRDNVGVVVDCWHFFRGHPDFDALASVPGSLIETVQLNDGFVVPPVDDPMEEVRRFRVLPGAGEFDVERLVSTVYRNAPDVRWSIEVATDELRSLRPSMAAETLVSACVEYLGRIPIDQPGT